MNDEQLKAAAFLIHLMDGDVVAQAHARTYGNWLEHLHDLMADELISDNKVSLTGEVAL